MILFNKKSLMLVIKIARRNITQTESFLTILKSFHLIQKSNYQLRLRFSFPPKKLNYADYLTNFELFYRSTQNLDVLSNGDLDFVKTKIKEASLSSFCFLF